MPLKEKKSTEWRKARLRLDLSQKEFGERLGVGAGYISEIESGKKEPSHTLSELFRYIYIEAFQTSEPTVNLEEKYASNVIEEDENMRQELTVAYRKIIERDEMIFKLTQELAETKEIISLSKRKSS